MQTHTMVMISILALGTSTAFAGTPRVPGTGAKTPTSEAPASLDKWVPAGTPEGVRDAVVSLHELMGYDAARDLLTLPYREEGLDSLIAEAWSPVFEVRSTALQLLALAVRQLDLPEETLHQRIPEAMRAMVDAAEPEGSPEAVRTSELAQRVLWHAEIRSATHPGQLLDALTAALGNRQDGYYYPIEALSYLADIGTEGARDVLDAKLAESANRSLSPKLLARVRTTRDKVDLQVQLRTLDPEAQVLLLTDALIASLPDPSLPARDFQTWVVRQLGSRQVEASEQTLSRLVDDEALRSDLRYEAEQELRELDKGGALKLPRPPAR